MAPTTVLRSAPSATPSHTGQPLSSGSEIDTGAPGFIAPLAIFTGIFILLMLSLMYQIAKLSQQQPEGMPPTDSTASSTVSFTANRRRTRAARKNEIGREVDAESFVSWRAKQVERMKTPAAFPTHVVCAVCLNEFADDDLVRDLACRHAYHVDCLDEWYSRGHNVCPMCKSTLCDAHSQKICEESPQRS